MLEGPLLRIVTRASDGFVWTKKKVDAMTRQTTRKRRVRTFLVRFMMGLIREMESSETLDLASAY